MAEEIENAQSDLLYLRSLLEPHGDEALKALDRLMAPSIENQENYSLWVSDGRPMTLDELAIMVERRYKQWPLSVERECLNDGIAALAEVADAIRKLSGLSSEVERDPSKFDVTGSSPVVRSNFLHESEC